MIAVNNLTISFGSRYLFKSVSFNINPDDRIGLVGRNGTGKSTLLKLIAKIEQPDSGQISMPKDFLVGYLPQEGIVESPLTVFDETMSALEHILKIKDEIENLTAEIETRTDYETQEYLDLIHNLSLANDKFKILGGHSIEADVEKVLLGLGFERSEFDKFCNEFSGGWQMRIELAKILLRKPDIILLDEPTNHLDIESIQWLENYLKNYPGAIVLVSHDRNFLNTVTNRTIEIASGKIFDFSVAFNEFEKLRDEQREHELNAFKNQQRQIRQTERFIERFRYKSTLASRVQSRIKQLEKLDRIELEDTDDSVIELKFPEPPRAGRIICEAKDLSKSYGDNLVLSRINFAIERGEKIAFVGKNGEGKSTLSRIIAGYEEYDGDFSLGYNVKIGYYAQHQAELLNANDTVFDVIDSTATGEMRKHIRTLLGAFLFSGDDVYKKVKVLSGGEKSRLALAKMLLEPVNFLILDEPTNHLDMIAKDVLKNALLEFPGTIVLVSHDRDFLDGLTEKTYHFKNKGISEYLGGIYDFLSKQEMEHLQELEKKATGTSDNKNKSTGKAKLEREEQKRRQREENKLKKKITACEDEIAAIENEIGELENQFAAPDFFKANENATEKQSRFEELKSLLESKMQEWETLHLEQEEQNQENN
jgi:ATP-binding cassette subfamily F protein 3